ncbi:MAG: alpha/beta fold hydrolase [Desulforhabdus sp.]|jgi:pimeloyl-ACP methyl ester carboxylesterase|nr:alpha/beta fold hydrolase [Desulforhabdus sp.]
MATGFLVAIFFYSAILFGFSLLTYLLFWYETANSSHQQHLDLISKGKIGRWLVRGIMSSFISQNLVILFYPLRFWRGFWHPKPEPTCPRPPVILIHGLYHNVTAWILYKWLLNRKGFRNTYAFGYSSANGNVEQLLEKLDQLINELGKKLPQQRIILIGHSLGGLLARFYVQDRSHAAKLAAVVTLGTPHRGTKLAALGVGKLAKSLIYNGQLFRELEPTKVSIDVPRLAIYSPIDNMVLPHDSLRVSQPGWTHLESYPVSHVAMLYHRPLARLVIEYLQIRALSPVVNDKGGQGECEETGLS